MAKSFPPIYSYNTDNIKQKIDFYDSIGLHELAINDTKKLMQSVSLSYARYMFYKEKNIENKFKLKIMQKRSEIQNVVEKIDALSPLKTLSRGYSIMEKNGKIVKSKKELNIGDEVNIKLYEGIIGNLKVDVISA